MDDSDKLFAKIEGRYQLKIDRKMYSLFLAGPNTNKHKYGEYFTLSIETIHEGSGGLQEIIFGSYELKDMTITLHGKKREQESWDELEEAEGEAMIEPFIGDVMECKILSETPKLQLRLYYDQSEIDLIKIFME